MAGMVGSNRGWREAPYVPCPADLDDLAKALVWAGDREAIIPGVSYIGEGRADVMRGKRSSFWEPPRRASSTLMRSFAIRAHTTNGLCSGTGRFTASGLS